MKKIAFFDTKPYDTHWFNELNTKYEIVYFENKLSAQTAPLAQGCDAVCAFVNDEIDRYAIEALCACGVQVIAMRSAGYNNVDFKAAAHKLTVVRVPEYSPYAVAEHAAALLLSLNRKIHKAYVRTREFNFSLVGLTGIDLHGKTVGIIGTGKIGRVFINICRGFGMDVIAYDPYPAQDSGISYVTLDELFQRSDVISLHCPLSEQTHHILNAESFAKMKDGVLLLNTSRGALVNSADLLDALNSGKVGGAALDVYEEEAEIFFEDYSATLMKDDVLALLVSRPNVLLTSHQAFLTEDALKAIAEVTLKNLDEFFDGQSLTNEVLYDAETGKIGSGGQRQKKQAILP